MDHSNILESPTKKGGKYQNTPNVVPLTIKQIDDIERNGEEGFKINNKEVSMVTVIGYVKDHSEQSTNISLKITDGTGTLTVKLWSEADKNYFITQHKSEWIKGNYVRVYGYLRPFKGTTTVVALRIKKIEDFNEITYHFADAMYSHFQSLHQLQSEPSSIEMQQDTDYADYNHEKLKTDIQNVLSNAPHPYGIHIDGIVQRLHHYGDAAIRETIHQLFEDGLVYNPKPDFYAASE